MALRLVEIVLRAGCEAELERVVGEVELLGRWSHALADGRVATRLLARSESVEPLLDAAQELCARDPDAHVLLLPVEAVVPAPQEPAAEPDRARDPAPIRGLRISRQELLDDLQHGSRIDALFLAMVTLSAVVAAVGLVRDQPAVVIGAMVIAPLLAPNMALSLATTLGDLALAGRALRTNLAGVAVALGLSVLIGLFGPWELGGGEILSRTEVSPGDVLLALAAGCAGALAFTTGAPAGLIGVMVAVALLPPLVVLGLAVGAGAWRGAAGAFLLLATNVICVNLAGVSTFLAQGIRPRSWWEERRARRATRIALLSWSALLLVLLVLIALARRRA